MNAPMGQFALDVERALGDLDAGWGMPTPWYHDPQVFRFEMDTIYGREWQYLGPTAKLGQPGDCIVGNAAEIPVFVVRAGDGTLRGFVNMCRHRGHPVARADGNARALVCRYHGWTYALDGHLERAPQSAGEPGFNPEDLSLLPIAVDTWGPAVFVNPDPKATPFRRSHPRFEELWQSRGLTPDLDAYAFRRRIEYDAKCNWKLWYDNNVECYHCPRIHGESFAAAYDVAPEKIDNFELDRILTNRFLATEDSDGNGLRSSNYRSMQLFPGITIIQQDDLMVLSQMIPLGPEQTVSVMDYFGESGCDEQRFEEWVALWDQTFVEDLTAVSNQQRGMRTGRLEKSRFMRTQERPLIFINRTILEAYRTGLAAGGRG